MNSEESRFKMVKEHHKNTYTKAKNDGKVDHEFIPLCDHILKTKNYFTSSSCAGRITLVGLDKKESKKESAFHRKWHRKVKFSEVKEGIDHFNGEVLWLKQEPLIFHIGADTIEHANNLLKASRTAGIKRCGVHVIKLGKYLVEMLGSHAITIPVKEGKFIVDEENLKYFVKKCNEKFVKNQKHLKELTKEIKKMTKK
jgi:tRNA wybutosine-synthesizing protein 3